VAEIHEFSELAKEGGAYAPLYALCREFYVALFDVLDGHPHTVVPRELHLIGEFSGFARSAHKAIVEGVVDLTGPMSGIAALIQEIRLLRS
jgi:hypothetical protein